MKIINYCLVVLVSLFALSCEKEVIDNETNNIPEPNLFIEAKSISAIATPDNVYGVDRQLTGEEASSSFFYKSLNTNVVELQTQNYWEFKEAIESASSGTTIKLNSDIYVNDASFSRTNIPSGVDIDGNNHTITVDGTNLPKTCDNDEDNYSYYLFASNVITGINQIERRITKLTIKGVSTENKDIRAIACDNVEIDHCKISGFSSGIIISETYNFVHHNDITDNLNHCHGQYGVELLSDSFSKIEYNYFVNNRHHISGNGNASGYEAAYNYIDKTNDIIPSNKKDTSFDMHGYTELECIEEKKSQAGELLLIHHNTFVHQENSAVSIRGIPAESAKVFNNFFNYDQNGEKYITQRRYAGNIYALNNKYKQLENRYKVSWSGNSNFENLNGVDTDIDLLIGDFDGNGRDDIVKRYELDFSNRKCNVAEKDTTETLYLIAKENIKENVYGTDWDYLNKSDVIFDKMLIGDFNGDGSDDLFRKEPNSSQWYCLYSGIGSWVSLASSGIDIKYLRVGDFNGDEKDDIFVSTGGQFKVSYGAGRGWQTLNTSSTSEKDLLFGDFIGDKRTDIVRVLNGEWHILDGGTGSWGNAVNSLSNYTASDLRVGDFNGDGKDDVFGLFSIVNSSLKSWKYFDFETNQWTDLNTSNQTLESMSLGDFNGDQITDVIYYSYDTIY